MRVVSPAEVERQIRQVGKRDGLFPLLQNGKCFVAQKERQWVFGAVVSVVTEELQPICSVNMNRPLGNVWRTRVHRHQFRATDFYRAARLRRERDARKVLLERRADRAAELERLRRRFGWADVVDAQLAAIRQGLRKQGR